MNPQGDWTPSSYLQGHTTLSAFLITVQHQPLGWCAKSQNAMRLFLQCNQESVVCVQVTVKTQGSSTTSILLKWVRNRQFLRENMFKFQGNLTWWTNTSSLVSFLQDKRKLNFINKMHSKLKIQLFGTKAKCKSIITGFQHYSSTCYQLVPISLLCVGKRSAFTKCKAQ